MNNIPKDVNVYSGKVHTNTFPEWWNHTDARLNALDILDELHTRVAILWLEGPALRFQTGWIVEYVDLGMWDDFSTLMIEYFADRDRNARWNRRFKGFRETVHEIV